MTLEPEHAIEEAHGLWELQVSRVAAMVEILFDDNTATVTSIQMETLRDASDDEREAFAHWQEVSKHALVNKVTIATPAQCSHDQVYGPGSVWPPSGGIVGTPGVLATPGGGLTGKGGT